MGRTLLAMPLNVGPLARGLEVPVEADSVAGPIVIYGKGPTSINFFTDDARWGRELLRNLTRFGFLAARMSPIVEAKASRTHGSLR